jgi:hypothetical protein
MHSSHAQGNFPFFTLLTLDDYTYELMTESAHQRLICVVAADDLDIMRFKTEHLPTEGKASEGKDHQHPFCVSCQA